ncbi:hypothetical protein ACS0TY_014354 [Phlomoides rotata]
MHSRLRILLARAARKSAALPAHSFQRNPRVALIGNYNTVANAAETPFRFQHRSLNYQSIVLRRHFCGYAIEQFSDDEYECDYENNPASSSVANIDEWKWKLSMLLRSDKDQEIVSRDKRDSEIYGKVVVASKVPLPNYRPDLDDKRPQREVVIPLSLQRRVEGLLQEHLDRTILNYEKQVTVGINRVQ